MLLRCVDGRPVRVVTPQLLAWLPARVAAAGQRALWRVWDKAAWPVSQAVRAWRKAHKRRVKRDGGCRLGVGPLPSQRPGLNRIEPTWVQGK